LRLQTANTKDVFAVIAKIAVIEGVKRATDHGSNGHLEERET
jgi:hypothetical protein